MFFILLISCKKVVFFSLATTRGSDAIFQGVISKKAMQHVTFMGFLENKQTNKSDLSVGHVEDQLFDPQQSQRVLFSDCNITKQTAGFVPVPGLLQVCARHYLLCKCRFTDMDTTHLLFHSGAALQMSSFV